MCLGELSSFLAEAAAFLSSPPKAVWAAETTGCVPQRLEESDYLLPLLPR